MDADRVPAATLAAIRATAMTATTLGVAMVVASTIPAVTPSLLSVASVAGVTIAAWSVAALFVALRDPRSPRLRAVSTAAACAAGVATLAALAVGLLLRGEGGEDLWVVRVGAAKLVAASASVALGASLASDGAKYEGRVGVLGATLAAIGLAVSIVLVRVTSSTAQVLVVTTLVVLVAAALAHLAARDLGVGPVPPATDAAREAAIAAREAGYRARRRAHEGIDAGRPVVGLALSGGGIRSATVCLGFLRGLQRTRKLRDIDLLTTVSGGGWAAGAYVAACLRGASRGRGADWDELVARFRARRAYLFTEGGPTVMEVVALAVRVLTGALANGLVALCACAAVGILVPLTSRRVVAPGVMALVERAAPWLRDAYPVCYAGDGCSSKVVDRSLAALDLVTVLAATSVVASAGLAALLVASYMKLVPAAASRALTGATSASLAVTLVLGLAHLVLRGSEVVTWLALAGLGGAALASLRKRLSWGSFAASGAGLLATQGVFSSVREGLTKATTTWHDGLLWVIRAPGLCVAAWEPKQQVAAAVMTLLCALVFVVFVDRNRTSLQGFWSQRIARAFLHDEDEGPILLSSVAALSAAPLHVVSCALNVPGSRDAAHAGRGTAHFEFTPFALGGGPTGWALAEHYGDRVTYDDAIGISAAALNSQGGVTIPTAARPLLALANLRLGYWLRNPRDASDLDDDSVPRWRRYLSRFRLDARLWSLHATLETLGLNSELDAMVLVSDGGHHDNLGLLAQVRRGAALVVCVDAAADPGYDFCDLGRTLHLLREEGWEQRDFDVDAMRPDGSSDAWEHRVVDKPVCVFRLVPDEALARGGAAPVTVVYVKSSLTRDAPFDVRAYAEREPTFPQQTTVDQSFDAHQFDAYFTVGDHLATCAAPLLESALGGLTKAPPDGAK